MMEAKGSPLYEAKRRFGECHPAKQLVMLLDRVEKLERIIEEAVKVKPEKKKK